MGGRQAEPSRFAVLRLLLSFTIRAISSNSVPKGNNVFKSDETVASKIKNSRCRSLDAGRQGCEESRRSTESLSQSRRFKRLLGRLAIEQPRLRFRLNLAPVTVEFLKQCRRHKHPTFMAVFAAAHSHQLLGPVQIIELELQHFRDAKPGAIGQFESGAIAHIESGLEQAHDIGFTDGPGQTILDRAAAQLCNPLGFAERFDVE